MKYKFSFIFGLIIFFTGCGGLMEEGKLHNLKLEKIQSAGSAYAGFPVKVKMTISSDKKAENVPYTLLMINKSDHINGAENPRYLTLTMFSTLDTVEKGTSDYEVEAVVPDIDGQAGDYYLVGMVDPASDLDGGGEELKDIEFLKEESLYASVSLDRSLVDKTDFFISEINTESDVVVIRDTDNVHGQVIGGSVEITTRGIKSQRNVPLSVFIANGNELVPVRLWDNEIKGYVNKYVIAELNPDKPSVVHFSVMLPVEARNYIQKCGVSEYNLTFAIDPDEKFDEPSITGVVDGEYNNVSEVPVSIVYEDESEIQNNTRSSRSAGGVTAVWNSETSMPSERIMSASVSIGTKIYVIGGQNSSGNPVNTVAVYDTAAKTWTTSSRTIKNARYGHTAAVCDGRIYIAGGTGEAGVLGSVESWSGLETEDWDDSFPGLSYPRWGHAMVAQDSYLYIIGGEGALNSVEYINTASSAVSWTSGKNLIRGRAHHGAEICVVRNTSIRKNEKAVIVVAGGTGGSASELTIGSIETIYLERYDNTPVEDPSLFRPSAANVWQMAGEITSTAAGFTTASLYGNLYIVGGLKKYNETKRTCAGGRRVSRCTESTTLLSVNLADVWVFDPFSKSLRKETQIPWASSLWSTMSETGTGTAYLIGGEGNPFSVQKLTVDYPSERVHFNVNPDLYAGNKNLVGGGGIFQLSSKFNSSGYHFDIDTGLVVDLFRVTLSPLRTEIKAHHFVNPEYDDFLEIRLTLLFQPVVYFQKKDKSVSLALTEVKDIINEMKDREEEGDDDDVEKPTEGKNRTEELKKGNIFELSYSLFNLKALPVKDRLVEQEHPEANIGPFFGIYLLLRWDGGVKAGWDFAIGFEKGAYGELTPSGEIELGLPQYGGIENPESSYGENTKTYNRAFIKPSFYGAVWGYLAAGVTFGKVLTFGIESDFDIVRLDVELIFANNFEFNNDETLYGTRRSIGWTGVLSCVKGEANLFVEAMFPAICSTKKWGIRWYYPCLKTQHKKLPWPNVSFTAFSIMLWNQHHNFGEVSDWVKYDPTIGPEDYIVDTVLGDIDDFFYSM